MSVQRNIHRSLLALVATLAAAVAVFIVLLGHAGFTVKPAATYRVNAIVPSAIRLVDFADVRQAGVKIGKVTSIAAHGRYVKLTMTLQRRYAPVYDNAKLLIGSKSLAGENFVDLDPGAPPGQPLRQGATLPLSRSPESTQLDQVIGVLKPKRVRDLRRIVEALGTGLGGRGTQLNDFIGAGSRSTTDGYDVMHALATERLAVTQLISDFGRVAQTLGQRGRDLRRFVRGSRQLSETFARNQANVSRTLVSAPGFLHTARESMRRMSRLAAVSTPVVRDTRVASEQMVPAIDHLPKAAAGARDALHQLTPFSHRAGPMLAATERLVPTAKAFMAPLEDSLREINPTLGYLKPYGRDMAVGAALVGATAKAQDGTGHLFRIMTIATSNVVGGVLSKDEQEALEALISTGHIVKHTTSRGKNAYPAPGPHKNLKDFTGAFPRITKDPPYG
jgi:phospholipid/cholesterol/gamma-HCH transport system substrate-binding protein